jgi:hypothetical protein
MTLTRNTSQMRIDRRALLTTLGVTAALFATRSARATVVQGLTLAALAQRSDCILIATALAAESRYVALGGSPRIVTDVRVRIEEIIAKTAPASPELEVRVLGGRVGGSAEFVEGQAELSLNAPCVLFLRRASAEIHWVNGMAQGHYPLREDRSGALRLNASPRLPEMLNLANSAVERLAGQELGAARALVQGALGQ